MLVILFFIYLFIIIYLEVCLVAYIKINNYCVNFMFII